MVERHQQRKLPVGEIERAEGIVETARQGPRRALGRQAQAGVAYQQRRLERNIRHKAIMLTSTYQVKLSRVPMWLLQCMDSLGAYFALVAPQR